MATKSVVASENFMYNELGDLQNQCRVTHLSLTSFLWDIGKQYSPRYDAAEHGVPSGVILFAQRNFIEK